jgi:hypothetical protein
MKVRVSLAVMVALCAVLAVGASMSSSATQASAATEDNAIVVWSGIAEAAIAAPAAPGGPLRPPASSSVLAGMVHAAMYDAVAATLGGLEPFATGVSAPPETSADAAVARAARDVLVARVPGQAQVVQAAYDAFVAAIPAGPGKDGGIAVGAAAAAGMLALRTGDHFDDVVPYVQPPLGPGVFRPIAPTTPVDVKLPFVRPFTFTEPSTYRPDPPYALTSKRYAEDVAETQETGRVVTSTRTAAMTETVRFYTDPTYRQYSRGMIELVRAQGLDLRESARLLGYTWVSVADTMIACWEAKYHYMFWRPNQAIGLADTDGNPATTPEVGWLPFVVGNHPEYPSGHACFTAGVTSSIHEYFGRKKVPLVMTSTTTGTTRTYPELDDIVEDVEDARVWGGLHYRTTMTTTAKFFPRIARNVGREYFLEGAHHRGGKG